jgi:5'(3')-deoxyribonucleotidase
MRKLLFVDMDNVLVDFPSGVARLDERTRRDFEGRLDEVPGVFARMDPLAGALEAYAELAARFDTYVLSTAPWENPSAWSDKLLWIQRHLGVLAHKRLILTHHKDLVHGDFLVDDRTKNGAERFRGEHIHFGTPRFPDWASVRAYLLARAGD